MRNADFMLGKSNFEMSIFAICSKGECTTTYKRFKMYMQWYAHKSKK